MMKKVIFNQYGSENVLQIIDSPIPAIANNQILVKVKAVSINLFAIGFQTVV